MIYSFPVTEHKLASMMYKEEEKLRKTICQALNNSAALLDLPSGAALRATSYATTTYYPRAGRASRD